MGTVKKNKEDLNVDRSIKARSETGNPKDQLPDPQVKIKKHYSAKRTFDIAYKLRIISAYDACETAVERGALLRKEGLYHSRIGDWKRQLNKSKSKSGKKQHNASRTAHLTRENEQLKKKLAQAEAIIELQKKISELLGMHILPHVNSE